MTPAVPYAAAARALLRETVVGAVDELTRTRGWAATTMADIAKAAGVSRQTLYNEFGSRPALVEAYVTHEIERIMVDVADAVRSHADDAHLALRSAFELFLKLASDEPIVQLVLNDAETGSLTRMLTGVGQTVAGERIAELIAEIWPQVPPPDTRIVADSLVRLAISHAIVPDDDPGVVATGVGRMLAPFVDQVLGD
ncbi:TetR/AcrR family transcriptional regulator [Jatrophihabitans fulvus]